MARPKPLPYVLSAREREVFSLLCAGHSNHEIATALSITPKTLESHIRRIYEKQAEPLETRGPARRIEFLSRMLRAR